MALVRDNVFRDNIERAIQPLLARGFSIFEVREWPQHQDLIVELKSSDLLLRFISERGQQFLDVAVVGKPGWYSLSELLAAAGLRSLDRPFDTAEVAANDFEQNERAVRDFLADDGRRAQLVARP